MSASYNTDTNMTQQNTDKIFGPDIEDPIDIDHDEEEANYVGVHNNLILDRSEVVRSLGSGREGERCRSYQDRMLVTLCFRQGVREILSNIST